MASTSNPLQIVDDDDEFDWEAVVQEIDVACAITTSNLIPSFSCEQDIVLNPALEMRKRGKFDVKSNSVSSSRQTTLDRFIGVSSGDSRKSVGKAECSNAFQGNNFNGVGIGDKNGGGDFADCGDTEMLNGAVNIYPVYLNVPLRDYQLSITQTALFSNTLVVLPTGLGKTLIAAVVMYNFFRWFPEGKIVFAAPSRPLVTQQIEACHKIIGIPQEWTIDLMGQIHPTKRAEFWKCKRVFFVTPQVLEKDIQSGSCLVKHLVCLVIDEDHRATGNYSCCVAVREGKRNAIVAALVVTIAAAVLIAFFCFCYPWRKLKNKAFDLYWHSVHIFYHFATLQTRIASGSSISSDCFCFHKPGGRRLLRVQRGQASSK